MGLFLVYTLKVAICLLFFFAFNKLILSKDTFHTFNRVAWLLVITTSLILPIFEWEGFESEVSTPLAVGFIESVAFVEILPEVVEPEPESSKIISIVKYSLIIYALFATLFFLRLGLSYIRLFAFVLPLRKLSVGDEKYIELLEECKKKIGYDKKIQFRIHEESVSPFSWMQYIVVSREDLDENGRDILIHELAHVKSKHSWDLLLVDLLIVFQWFNPAAWLCKQSLQQVHEYKADESVLEAGVNAKQYQLLLIKKAVGQRLYSMANSFNHSKLKNRITMMLKEKSNKWALAKCLYALPLAFLAVTAFARPEISNHFSEISSVKFTQFSENADHLSEKNEATEEIVGESSTSIRGITAYGDHGESNVTSLDTVIEKNNFVITNFFSFTIPSETKLAEMKKVIKSLTAEGLVKSVTFKVRAVEKDILVVMSLKDKDAIAKVTKALKLNNDLHAKAEKTYEIVDAGSVKDSTVINFILGRNVDSKALILIDDVEKSKKDLTNLNPDEIKSVSILKVGSATALYGDRGKDGVILITTKASAEKAETPFLVVEKMPTFKGGDINKFRTWVQAQIKYPEEAMKNKVQGRVNISFVIEKNGTLSDINVVQSPDKLLSAEAVRILKTSPKWVNGEQRGKAVRVKHTLPIDFKISGDDEDETPFLVVQKMPTFQGGDINKFRTWVQAQIKYPEEAMKNKVQGKVNISFVIEKNGTLSDINVVQSPDKLLSAEVIRILKTSPKWVNGEQRGKAVRVKHTLPIDFKIH